MEDLKTQITDLLEKIIYVHLKINWVEKLTASGVKNEEARVWAAEIGHVVDEYLSTLNALMEIISREPDPETIPEEIYHWVMWVRTLSISEIDEPLQRLESALEKYIPPDEDEE